MLGLIFRCVRKNAHPDLCHLFPFALNIARHNTRLQENRHRLQLTEYREGSHHKLIERSVFGLVRIWNRLPSPLIEASTVSNFQKGLTELARACCRLNLVDWADTLSPRQLLAPVRETAFSDIVSYSS